MKNKHLIIVFLLFLPIVFFAQESIDLNSLPEVEDYIEIRSNPDADTVIIALHGGPTDIPDFGHFYYFEDIPGMSVVEIKQYQHLNPDVYYDSTMTLLEAITYNDTTVALVRKVVNYYNEQNKEVILIGHSFGAFILTEYIDNYGIEDIFKIIPMSGRLNMNQEVVDAFASGYFAGFIDGEQVYIEPNMSPNTFWGRMKLMAGYGYNRYVDLLSNVDMTNLMYVYSTHDQAVGRLLPEEIELLENNNATVYQIPAGNHSSPFNTNRLEDVLEFIRSTITGLPDLMTADANMYPTIIKTHLTVESPDNGIIRIFDIKGREILGQKLFGGIQKIHMSGFQPGPYIAIFQNEKNQMIHRKIIKQ